jgi:hypothetical protein
MDDQEIMKKILALIDTKKIESQGDILDWRRSEVRVVQSDS